MCAHVCHRRYKMESNVQKCKGWKALNFYISSQVLRHTDFRECQRTWQPEYAIPPSPLSHASELKNGSLFLLIYFSKMVNWISDFNILRISEKCRIFGPYYACRNIILILPLLVLDGGWRRRLGGKTFSQSGGGEIRFSSCPQEYTNILTKRMIE